jgi:hypothetical protein
MTARPKSAYDDVATFVREQTQAHGVVVLVYKGNQGDGCAVQLPVESRAQMAEMFQLMADAIRAGIQARLPAHALRCSECGEVFDALTVCAGCASILTLVTPVRTRLLTADEIGALSDPVRNFALRLRRNVQTKG